VHALSRVSAFRRALNSHKKAEPRRGSKRGRQGQVRAFKGLRSRYMDVAVSETARGQRWRAAKYQRLGAAMPHRTTELRGNARVSVSSWGRRGQRSWHVHHRCRRLEDVACYLLLRRSGRHPWLARKEIAKIHSSPTTKQPCLTPRSKGAPAAGHQGPVGGTRYIFANRALASHRWRPLSSNVRPHKPTAPATRCACEQPPRLPLPLLRLRDILRTAGLLRNLRHLRLGRRSRSTSAPSYGRWRKSTVPYGSAACRAQGEARRSSDCRRFQTREQMAPAAKRRPSRRDRTVFWG